MMRSEDLQTRVLARHLRQRLEGRCPAHILAALSDDKLVEKYHAHEAAKLAWANTPKTVSSRPAVNGLGMRQ